MKSVCATLLFCASLTLFLHSGPASSAEDGTGQFDFWLGKWDLSSAGKSTGTNTITREYDGAVIMEHFAGSGDNPLNGMSVSVFNKGTGKWHQTWVDNQSAYLDFTGGFADGKMILSRHATIQGKEVLQRMVWFNITPDSLDWNWERSDDDGATWQVLWPIHYTRMKE